MKFSYLMTLVLVAGLTVGAPMVSAGTHLVGPDTSLSFEPGKAALTQASVNNLNNMVKEARQKGKLEEIKIAVWSDNPAPRDGEQLSSADRDLANRRIETVRNHLKNLKVADVDTYNMAERASWLARTFNTDNAELKSEIGRGGDGPMSKLEFQIFRDKGAPSKAVALTIVEQRLAE